MSARSVDDRKVRACRRKIKYTNVMAAMQAFIGTATNPRQAYVTLQIYVCENCNGWHLGKQRERRTQRKFKKSRGMRKIGLLMAKAKTEVVR